MQYRNVWLGMFSSLQPTNAKSNILLHPDLGLRDPLQSGLVTLFSQWRSLWSFVGCGGTHNSHSLILILYRANVRSKLDYGCIVYGIASNTDLRQLDSIHNSGLGLALGAICTGPVSSLYTEVNEAPLEERRFKLSMHYYLKTRACIDNRAHHALHEFDRTTRDLYAPRPSGRGGMTLAITKSWMKTTRKTPQ